MQKQLLINLPNKVRYIMKIIMCEVHFINQMKMKTRSTFY